MDLKLSGKGLPLGKTISIKLRVVSSTKGDGMQFFLKRDDEIRGPFTSEQLIEFHKNKKITADDFFWQICF